ncbi:M23 family metallopeptidase [Streptomyces sp. MST-110588]|nr:M23 family metallopeptidase [Streptomyces sp. MST-110588]
MPDLDMPGLDTSFPDRSSMDAPFPDAPLTDTPWGPPAPLAPSSPAPSSPAPSSRASSPYDSSPDGPSAPGRQPEMRSSGAPAPRGGAERLADVSLEVIELDQVERRAARSYARERRAARVQRAVTRRLMAALRRERRAAAELHRTVGRLADEQYRTGSVMPFAARPPAASVPRSSAQARGAAVRSQRALARRAREALRESRRLAVAGEAAATRLEELDARRDRLARKYGRLSRGLDTARARLQVLARRAAVGGDCGVLPGTAVSAAAALAPVSASRRGWTRPVEHYRLSASFGGAGGHWAKGHTGQDFAVPAGTSVQSVGWGRVVGLTCGDGFGISMVVRHGERLYSQYAHLSAAMVAVGQRVRPGQRIGLSGTTGNSTGPHLHFEVRRTPALGSGIDPVPWLRKRGVRL